MEKDHPIGRCWYEISPRHRGVGGYTKMSKCPPHSGTPDDWFSLITVSFSTNDFRYLHGCHIHVWFEFILFCTQWNDIMNLCMYIWVFPKIGVPQNEWFIRENHIRIDDVGVPPFLESPISTCMYKWCSHPRTKISTRRLSVFGRRFLGKSYPLTFQAASGLKQTSHFFSANPHLS